MPALRTTTTCKNCGGEIPATPLAHAVCVRCRAELDSYEISSCGETDPDIFQKAEAANARILFEASTLPSDETELLEGPRKTLDVIAGDGTPEAILKRFACVLSNFGIGPIGQLTGDELAALLGIKKARVSQIKSDAAKLLPSARPRKIRGKAAQLRAKCNSN